MRQLIVIAALLVAGCDQQGQPAPAPPATQPAAKLEFPKAPPVPVVEIPRTTKPNQLFACMDPDVGEPLTIPAGTMYKAWGKLVGSVMQPDPDPDYHGHGERIVMTMAPLPLTPKAPCGLVEVHFVRGGAWGKGGRILAKPREQYQADWSPALRTENVVFDELYKGSLNAALASDVVDSFDMPPGSDWDDEVIKRFAAANHET